MSLWGGMPNPPETTANRGTLVCGAAWPRTGAGPGRAGRGRSATVTVSLCVGSVPCSDAVSGCVSAPLRGVSACLRATVGLPRAGCPALGGVRGLAGPAAPGGRARRRARGHAAAAHLGAAGHGARAGERRRLRALGGGSRLHLPMADPAALVARPVPAEDS